jgi:Cu(I)/Ag(I) efflux system membrane protein CusA/SilA
MFGRRVSCAIQASGTILGAQKNLAELRTIQDWYIRYGIAKAEGVAEVASVGGFVKQYSVVIDPRRLQALGIPLARIREALRTSNMDVGGRTVELAETEYAVRGRGITPWTEQHNAGWESMRGALSG